MFPSVKSDLDVKRLRLKNGATVVYSSSDWGEPSKIVGVFFKNGGTLKFNKKTGFPALAQQIISSRMKVLSRDIGFRFKSYLAWDYLAYVLYLPPNINSEQLSKIWKVLYGNEAIDLHELELARNAVTSSIRYSLGQKVLTSPMIGFMSHHSSVYSVGKYGSQEDVESVDPKELSEFIGCYINPNNSFISSSAEKDVRVLTSGINPVKPCFRDERFEDEGMVTLNVPNRSVNYIRSEKKNFMIRFAFPSTSCERKENVIYDLIAEIFRQDEVISSLSGQVKINNQCYLNKGVLEIVLADVKKDADETSNRLLQRVKFLATDLDASVLSSAKGELEKKFWDDLGDKATFVYVLGKAQCSSKDYENIFKYRDLNETIGVPEVKELLKNISEDNMYKMYIKQEG